MPNSLFSSVLFPLIVLIGVFHSPINAQTTHAGVQVTADTLYFRPKENGKALPALYDFWDMRKTGDRTAFFLFNRPDERAYLADPVSLTFEPVIIRNLPEEIRTFSPFNRIIFPEKNIILWFTNVWIVMTNLDKEYLNHLVSPYTAYAEILQRENYE